jgi:hypothetical protein
MSFRLSARISVTPKGRISVKFGFGEILRISVYKKQNLVQIGRLYRAPYVKTTVNLVCFLQNEEKIVSYGQDF